MERLLLKNGISSTRPKRQIFRKSFSKTSANV